VGRATETVIAVIDGDLANQLVALWTAVLARTQYPNEILTAPDGSSIETIRLDGTMYHFWHDGRSASTHSTGPGTLLSDFVGTTHDLLAYIEAPKVQQAAAEAKVKARIGPLMRRIKRGEPCLRAEPWVAAPQKDHRRR